MEEKDGIQEEVRGVRARVLSTALDAIRSNPDVPSTLTSKLEQSLSTERPPKAAEIVALLEEHFQEGGS